MLTGARIIAIAPTTDLARAKAFYGEILGLLDANVPTYYSCRFTASA